MNINTSNSEIVFVENISQNIKKVIDSGLYDRYYFVVDENTKMYCLPLVTKELDGSFYEIIETKSGEYHKSIESVVEIWNVLNTTEATRKSLLINVGGGLVCDMGGFAASTFKRGIEFINIPTTLLSQVDASVGGKTGVNFNSFKNEVGVFNSPGKVFISSVFLDTLSEEEKNSGVGEMLKHALIYDKEHWEELKKWVNGGMDFSNNKLLQSLIYRSVEVKANVVKEDPTEKGIRKALNFGHTIAHAIESLSFKQNRHISHGHAVALGLICEANLSLANKRLNQDEFEDIKQIVHDIYPKYDISESDVADLVNFMYHDKKNEGAKINFTLLKNIGDFSIDNYIDETLIRESLKTIVNS